ncbi:hypothetical protein [Schaedlerella arabinosiphila]|jgi:hypothetical protein|nr:hypothetical protein [Schaedlerella arabinosiphila]
MQDFILNHTTCGKIIGEKMYFSDGGFNGLFCMDLQSEQCGFIDFFKGEEIDEYHLHKNCVLYREWLFFLPQRSRFIHAYNIKTGEQNNIFMDRQEDRKQRFLYETMQCGCYLYHVPIDTDTPLLRLNMDRQILEEDHRFSDWCRKHMPDIDRKLGARWAFKGEDIYAVVFDSDLVIRWNITLGEGQIYHTAEHLFGISNAADGFWLLTMTSGSIFFWAPDQGIKAYAGTQEAFEIKPYNHIIDTGRITVAVPTKGDDLQIRTKDGLFKSYHLRQYLSFGFQEEMGFYGFDSDDRRICLFLSSGQGAVVLDIENQKISWISMRLEDPEQVGRIETERIKKRVRNGEIIGECKWWSLENLIADVKEYEPDHMETNMEFGKTIYKELCKRT